MMLLDEKRIEIEWINSLGLGFVVVLTYNRPINNWKLSMALDLTPNEFVGYRIKPDYHNYTVGIVRRYGPGSKLAGQEYFKPMAYCKDVSQAASMLFNFALRTRGEAAQDEQGLLDKSCADMKAFQCAVNDAKADVLAAIAELQSKIDVLGLNASQLAKILGTSAGDEVAGEHDDATGKD